jgi:hypothetical protein
VQGIIRSCNSLPPISPRDGVAVSDRDASRSSPPELVMTATLRVVLFVFSTSSVQYLGPHLHFGIHAFLWKRRTLQACVTPDRPQSEYALHNSPV